MRTRSARPARPGRADQAPLTGREEELSHLRAAVDRVAGGDPGAVVLSGPPGVGKTRLAREALAVAERAGFAALAGRCDTTGSGAAYAPFVEALGAALRRTDEARRRRLTGDLPQLGLLIAGLGLSPPGPLGDPALERARLAEGFLRLIDRLAHERPLALLVDDAHAADACAATLLRRLLTGAVDQPILLVCTVRHDDPPADAHNLLADISDAAVRVDYLDVTPLPAAATRELAGALLGGTLDERLAELVIDRCAGRPLLVQAVVQTLTESGMLIPAGDALGLRPGAELPLPTGVRAQLRGRLSRAGADEQALLRTLAVAGEADVDLLLHAAGLARERVLDALDRLYERGLLAASDPSAPYALAHGLLRETLLADLSPAATQRAHAALVAALAATGGPQLRTADHALAAGPLVPRDDALALLRAAATDASQIGLTDRAARYLQAGADIARADGHTGALPGVLADLAAAYTHQADFVRARAAWSEAAALSTKRGDPLGTARATRELALLAWTGGDLTGAREALAAAERSLEGLEPTGEHAWLLHAKVVTGIRRGDVAAVRAAAEQLRTLADELGTPSVTARALLAEGALRYAETDYLAAAEYDRRGLAAARAGDEPLLVLRAHDQLSVVAGAQLDLPRLREHSQASLDVAQRLGSVSLAGWPRARLAVTDLLGGDWDGALRGSSELVTAVAQTDELRGRVAMFAIRSWILTRHGRLTAAREALTQAHQTAGDALRADHNIFTVVALAEVTLALADDDPARALAQRPLLADLTSGWLPLLGLATLGEAALRCGDLGGGRDIATRLRGIASHATSAPEVLADWLDGLAAAALPAAAGPATAGGRQLRKAAGGFDRLGLPWHAARARLATAGRTDCRDDAVELARSALAVFDRLGAPREAERARTLLRSYGVTPSRGRARRETGSVLSGRELDVARLVATGLSNAEVATRLFISPRTVSTHLDRMYGKLGLSSRAALTRYLADSGLLDDAPDR